MSADPSSLSIKELKASIVAFIGERALQSKNFVEKSQLVDFLREQQELARSKKDGVQAVPAGKYILGDPCFAATDVLHLETFNETYYDSENEEDEQEKQKQKKTGTGNSGKKRKANTEKEEQKAPREARFNDTTIVTAFNTHYNGGSGSTWFADTTNKYNFLVNGGVIALVPFEYNPKFNSAEVDSVAHVVEFNKPARCFAESNGVLHFGDIIIDSRKPMMAAKAKKHTSGSSRAKPKRRKADEYEDVDDDEEEIGEDEEEEEEEEDYSDENSDDDSNESEEEEEEDFDDETWQPEEKQPKKKRQKLQQKSRSAAAQDSESEEVDFD